MSLKFLKALAWNGVYDNTIDPYVPQHWANESLAILEENMVMANLVHRDFQDQLADFGDVVNTRRPGEFIAKRKGVNDNIVIQNATSTNVPVPLNQQLHVAFQIRDTERSKSFKDLVKEYMKPAMLAEARGVDKMMLGQAYRFKANAYGHLGALTSSNVVDYLTGVRNKMNINKAYVDGRNLILSPNAETAFLRNAQFTDADKVGDKGSAQREASLGRKYGFDIYMCQNAPSLSDLNTKKSGAVNNAAGYAAGTTVLTVDGFTGEVTVGAYITIAGDDQPHRVTAETPTLSNTTSVTITPALVYDVADNAVVKSWTPGAVNLVAGYAAGYDGTIVVDGFTVAPQVGQLVQFGTADTNVYTVLESSTTGIILDRPLDAAIVNDAIVAVGPPGEYNFAFHRNALALVVRPLAQPLPGTGARSAVVSLNGLSVRVVMQYDINAQATIVVIDMLLGTAVLDVNLGSLLYG